LKTQQEKALQNRQSTFNRLVTVLVEMSG